MAQHRRTHEDYRIGIICALAVEKAAMVAMLDETHPTLKKKDGDENNYTVGRIGVHNVVIACLPAGSMGNGPMAVVATNMLRSFSIKFGFMVGIGGGVWSRKNDIRLGDVVVSQPTGSHGGVVQWDFGKREKDGKFQRTGSLGNPPAVLLHALQALKTFDVTDGVDLERSLALMVQNKPRMGEVYRHKGMDQDRLFEATYDHIDETCEKCNPGQMVQRPVRRDSTPRIHYGNIASGNEVMRNGVTRDNIAKVEDVICFDAAGLMDSYPCLVIRGICDYADSHKNDIWQPYEAATAAAFAREFLAFVDEQELIETSRPEKPFLVPYPQNPGLSADILHNLGRVYMDERKFTEALHNLQRALQSFESVLGISHPRVPLTLHHKEMLLLDQGKFDQPMQDYLEVNAGQQRRLRAFNDIKAYCASVIDVGHVYSAMGNHRKAIEWFGKCLTYCKPLLDLPPELAPNVLQNMACSHVEPGETTRAMELLEQAQDDPGPSVPGKLDDDMSWTAKALFTQGSYDVAIRLCEDTLKDMTERGVEPDEPSLLLIKEVMAHYFAGQDHPDKAQPLVEEAIQGRSNYWDEDHRAVLLLQVLVSRLLALRGEYDLANQMSLKALAGLQKSLGDDHPHTLEAMIGRGDVLSLQGNDADALSQYNAAWMGFENRLGVENTHTLDARDKWMKTAERMNSGM